MDNEILAKEMLKDFIGRTPVPIKGYRWGCPFYDNNTNGYYHELCAVVFPGWGRKYLKGKLAYSQGTDSCCPCAKMSIRYVRRKARAFVKKK